MNNSKNILEEILNVDLFDLSLLETIKTTHKLKMLSLKTTPLASTLEILKKKNQNLRFEIEKLKVLETKKSEIYNKINSERLSLAKKYINMEDFIINLKNKEYDKEIEDLEKKLRNVNKPSYNKLYLVILNGFGLSFIKTGNKNICRIRNKTNKNICEIEVDKQDEPLYITTNKIWENI
ncbi:hypothetical protein NBO_591g0002 [Nosema bombycis CQ1]|uniref:Kinetochore protein Spc24 n=1 Tax=Nosema bombycis (strain CQ1 / CVCC 102059) TaxID=578461 RepID=R0MD67_NOSB1|nr:hypothetical protein NBO_591g0002 [Nosema bombycis CQ1]|eukprot:EOB12010.1 hypothetical protein NBO_591g0002 [Nosema bombycis CQ1]